MDIFNMIAGRGRQPIDPRILASLPQLGGTGPLGDARLPPPPLPVGGPGGGSPMPPVDFGAGNGPLAAPNMDRVQGGLDVIGTQPLPGGEPQRQGPLGRIGDFLHSDDGRAALFRASAALLGGGTIGDGMMAGANMIDTRRREDLAQSNVDRTFGQRDTQLDISRQGNEIDAAYKGGQLANARQGQLIDMLTLEEAKRKNLAGEALTAEQQDVLERNNIRTTTASLQATAAGERNNIRTNEQSDVNNLRTTDASRYGTDSSRYTAAENRAWSMGPTATTVRRDENGDPIETATARRPAYGELRYDESGQAYRLDPLTGQPIPVTPSVIGTRGPLAR